MKQRNRREQNTAGLKAEDQISSRAHKLHIELFPEEYDYVYDSISEDMDRSRGENPMNAEYIQRTNHRRALLGFSPFEVGRSSRNKNTLAWVSEKLRLGKESELQDLVASRAQEDAEAKHEKEQARQKLQTPSWLDQRIDEMLASKRFFHEKQDLENPNVIAFRILGELYGVNMSGNSNPDFFRQIRRIIPNRSESEYQDMLQYAKRKWMVVYGFDLRATR